MAHTLKAKEIQRIKHAIQQQLDTILYRLIGPLGNYLRNGDKLQVKMYPFVSFSRFPQYNKYNKLEELKSTVIVTSVLSSAQYVAAMSLEKDELNKRKQPSFRLPM